MELPTSPTTGATKFTDAEINELINIRHAYEQLTLSLGQLEMQKRDLKKTEIKINENLVAVENQEKAFLDKIVAKYGEGTFDSATGVFTPKKA